jgi:integrase/recombinase XerD
MKPFESFLAKQIEEYLTYRQNLGYKDQTLRSRLRSFDRYLKKNNSEWDSFTPSFFLTFRANLKGQSCTMNSILSAARLFFQFLVRRQIVEQNPLLDLPALKEGAFMPFVFCPEETEKLLGVAQKTVRKDEKHFLQDLATYLALVLLARCGLRISEPLRLLRTRFRPQEGTIYIEKTKFNKDRLIPIPKSVIPQIQNYLAVRDGLLGEDKNPYLLAGKKQKRLSNQKVYSLFRQAVKDTGLETPRKTLGNMTFGSPTPHSLRHSFAVNTLKRIKEQGGSPQNALPILAAYMGHAKYDYTCVYLKVLDALQHRRLVNFAKGHHEDL